MTNTKTPGKTVNPLPLGSAPWLTAWLEGNLTLQRQLAVRSPTATTLDP